MQILKAKKQINTLLLKNNNNNNKHMPIVILVIWCVFLLLTQIGFIALQ